MTKLKTWQQKHPRVPLRDSGVFSLKNRITSQGVGFSGAPCSTTREYQLYWSSPASLSSFSSQVMPRELTCQLLELWEAQFAFWSPINMWCEFPSKSVSRKQGVGTVWFPLTWKQPVWQLIWMSFVENISMSWIIALWQERAKSYFVLASH